MYIFSGGMVLGSLTRGCRDIPYNGDSGECIHSNFDVGKFFSEAKLEDLMINEDMVNVTLCLCFDEKCNDMHFNLVTPHQNYQTSAMSTETDTIWTISGFGDNMTTDFPGGLGDTTLSEVDMEYAALTASTEADDIKSENNIARAVNCNTIKGIVVHFLIVKYCITGLFT